MKTKLIIIGMGLLLCTNSVNAQGLKFGGKVSIGFGGMDNGGTLQEYYDYRLLKDKDVTTMSFDYSSGTSINIGGVIGYEFNEMFSINSGIEFQKLSNEIDIQEIKIKDQSDGSFRESNSTTKIAISSLIIPLTFKARFGESSFKPFVEGGLSLELRVSKTIESEEDRSEWDGTDQEFKNTRFVFADKDLDGLNGSTLNYIIGGGVDYELNEKMTLVFSLRYSANLGSSELWTKNLNSNSVDVGDNNRIFDSSDQATLRSDGFILDDWKSSLFSINIGIIF